MASSGDSMPPKGFQDLIDQVPQLIVYLHRSLAEVQWNHALQSEMDDQKQDLNWERNACEYEKVANNK